jgi:hypothetical protein
MGFVWHSGVQVHEGHLDGGRALLVPGSQRFVVRTVELACGVFTIEVIEGLAHVLRLVQ